MPQTFESKLVPPLEALLSGYRREDLIGDLIAGLVVAIVLIPQAMAYAMLAGLPPQIGLYASLAPLILYACLGSSKVLAVGPVAMISLMVASGLGELGFTAGSPEFLAACLTLALMVGIIQVLMSLLHLGFLVNFISHPVLVGFTSAAALVIGFSQCKHLLGISIEAGHGPLRMIVDTIMHMGQANITALGIGLGCCVLLLFFRIAIHPLCLKLGLPNRFGAAVSKLGPLVAVLFAAITVFGGNLNTNASIAIVGEIPRGLPELSIPDLRWTTLRDLFPLAIVITLVGYLESISVAKSLASRRREKISADRELMALGIADIAAAFTSGYPVTGGFSRSLVNYSAGARTSISSLFTALLVGIAILFLTPWFFYIPHTALAAIIIIAVTGLVDWKAPIRLWRCCRTDATAFVVTFITVIILGIEQGILAGIATTILLQMWKSSRPPIVEISGMPVPEKIGPLHHPKTEPSQGVLALRIDSALNFTNAHYLENYVMNLLANRNDVESLVLVSSRIHDIDTTGIEVLENLQHELQNHGVRFYLSDVKESVRNRLKLAGLDLDFLDPPIFYGAHQATQDASRPDGLARRQTNPSSPTLAVED